LDQRIKRIKSFCAAEPAQKLGWADAGAGPAGGRDYGIFTCRRLIAA
jgi:hypothetical protein